MGIEEKREFLSMASRETRRPTYKEYAREQLDARLACRAKAEEFNFLESRTGVREGGRFPFRQWQAVVSQAPGAFCEETWHTSRRGAD